MIRLIFLVQGQNAGANAASGGAFAEIGASAFFFPFQAIANRETSQTDISHASSRRRQVRSLHHHRAQLLHHRGLPALLRPALRGRPRAREHHPLCPLRPLPRQPQQVQRQRQRRQRRQSGQSGQSCRGARYSESARRRRRPGPVPRRRLGRIAQQQRLADRARGCRPRLDGCPVPRKERYGCQAGTPSGPWGGGEGWAGAGAGDQSGENVRDFTGLDGGVFGYRFVGWFEAEKLRSFIVVRVYVLDIGL